MSNITFICEGPSEKLFVDFILDPYWKNKGLQILCNPIVIGEGNPCCKGTGGDISYNRLKIDLSSAMNDDKDNSFFTTIFDFYGLHGEWPGKNLFRDGMSASEKVTTIERETKNLLITEYPALSISDRFVPYFMLHEYESLLFSRPSAITEITKAKQVTNQLEKILSDFNSMPEEINTQSSPSNRLASAKANYSKMYHAHQIVKLIGIDTIRSRCPHFNDWMTNLEHL